jgi:hypothetical protein
MFSKIFRFDLFAFLEFWRGRIRIWITLEQLKQSYGETIFLNSDNSDSSCLPADVHFWDFCYHASFCGTPLEKFDHALLTHRRMEKRYYKRLVNGCYSIWFGIFRGPKADFSHENLKSTYDHILRTFQYEDSEDRVMRVVRRLEPFIHHLRRTTIGILWESRLQGGSILLRCEEDISKLLAFLETRMDKLNWIELYYIILYYIGLYYIVLHCIALPWLRQIWSVLDYSEKTLSCHPFTWHDWTHRIYRSHRSDANDSYLIFGLDGSNHMWR